jgi:hypothetical protein
MEIGGLLAVAATAGVMYAVVLLVARGPDTLGAMFHAEQPGWPHGVQEDDDFRWRWNGSHGSPRGRDSSDPPAPVAVQPLRPVLRIAPQPPRSEARARS